MPNHFPNINSHPRRGHQPFRGMIESPLSPDVFDSVMADVSHIWIDGQSFSDWGRCAKCGQSWTSVYSNTLYCSRCHLYGGTHTLVRSFAEVAEANSQQLDALLASIDPKDFISFYIGRPTIGDPLAHLTQTLRFDDQQVADLFGKAPPITITKADALRYGVELSPWYDYDPTHEVYTRRERAGSITQIAEVLDLVGDTPIAKWRPEILVIDDPDVPNA